MSLQVSITGHALESVLEVEVLLMNVIISRGRRIAEIVIRLLGVGFAPG